MSVTTFERFAAHCARHPSFPTIPGSYQKYHTPFGVLRSLTMAVGWHLYKLVFSNKGRYNRVLTTFNDQSLLPWKCQYFNPYWLSSDHNNGITQKLYFFDNYTLHKYFIIVAYPLHS